MVLAQNKEMAARLSERGVTCGDAVATRGVLLSSRKASVSTGTR